MQTIIGMIQTAQFHKLKKTGPAKMAFGHKLHPIT